MPIIPQILFVFLALAGLLLAYAGVFVTVFFSSELKEGGDKILFLTIPFGGFIFLFGLTITIVSILTLAGY